MYTNITCNFSSKRGMNTGMFHRKRTLSNLHDTPHRNFDRILLVIAPALLLVILGNYSTCNWGRNFTCSCRPTCNFTAWVGFVRDF